MTDSRDKITVLDNMRRLTEAVRAAKIATADRNDVVVDLREADRARLEILAQELDDVFDSVPDDDQQWDFVISSGLQPRLWLDATAHVMMAHDRRVYRFVRDTRLGRIVMTESSDPKVIADGVTKYIASRIVERQQQMEGDVRELRPRARPVSRRTEPAETPAEAPARAEAPGRRSEFITGLVWFIIGMVTGAGLLAAAFWHSFMPTM